MNRSSLPAGRIGKMLRGVLAGLVALWTPLAAQAPVAVQHAASQSPLVQSSFRFLLAQARLIRDSALRAATLDAINNPNTCIAHRRNLPADRKQQILATLRADSLLLVADVEHARLGVFPDVRDDGTACPRLRQSFVVSAGGNGGHHDYPGGLPVHEAYNLTGGLQLARLNDSMYYHAPVIRLDIVRAATIWHDWAKTMVLPWNANGTLTPEIEIAGTGAHHILGVAEAMARNLPVDEVLAQVSSHAAPGLRDNAKLVQWVRAAAIIAQRDPVAAHYLIRAEDGSLQLATVAIHGGDSLLRARPVPYSAFPEAAIVNVSDENLYSIAATAQVEPALALVAPSFGYSAADTARYRNDFRNPILSYLGADRLAGILSRNGLDGFSRAMVGAFALIRANSAH